MRSGNRVWSSRPDFRRTRFKDTVAPSMEVGFLVCIQTDDLLGLP